MHTIFSSTQKKVISFSKTVVLDKGFKEIIYHGQDQKK